MKKIKCRSGRSFGFAVAVLGSYLLPVSESQASVIINPGWDLLVTAGGTSFQGIPFKGGDLNSFDFGGAIGVKNVGAADTIVRRIDQAVAPSTTINIELVALQLRSVSPVDLGAGLGIYYATLDPTTPSLGTMDITFDGNHGSPDLPGAGGTWTSTIDLNYDIRFGSANGPIVLTGNVPDFVTLNPVDWSHDLYPGDFPIDGVNHNLNGVDNSTDFFSGPAIHVDRRGNPPTHIHIIEPIPEVTSSFALAGLLGLSMFMRKRS